MIRVLEVRDLQDRSLEKAILSAVRGRVECLTVTEMHTQLITSHFVGLRELTLTRHSPPPYRYGERRNKEKVPKIPKDIWKAVRPTLESLRIEHLTPEHSDKEMFGNIQAYYRKLTSVEIVFKHDFWEQFAELLISYGMQLKNAWLFNGNGAIPLPILQSILAACPNLRTALGVVGSLDHIRAMASYGKAIYAKSSFMEYGPPTDVRLACTALGASSRVETITLCPSTTAELTFTLQEMKLNAKPKLKSLEFRVNQFGLVTTALRCIAQDTGALQRFHETISPQVRESWEAVALANPCLEDVSIGLMLDDDISEDEQAYYYR